jgi:phospho-N-acetylmuramoyl-pentapeptide-transferase
MLHWFLSVWCQPDHELVAALSSTAARTLLAVMVSALLALVAGPRVIRWLTAEPLKTDSARLAELSRSKRHTPSMGGLFLVGALAAAVLLLADLRAPAVQQSLVLLLGLTLVGICDDVAKRRMRRRGLSARGKLTGQIAVAALVAFMLIRQHSILPGDAWREMAGIGPMKMAVWLAPWAVIMIVGMSNAVNLTDGLDGLAGGCVLIAGAALMMVMGADELLVVGGSLIGAVAGFLRFNVHPARVFMGDTGSLPLGGLLGLLAVATGHELFLLVTCGVLLAEVASVVLQVGSYKLRRKRIFLCAPLHHHFQFAGWPEKKIVRSFWGAAAVCAALGLSTRFWPGERTRPSPAASEEYRPVARSQQVIR